MALEGRIKDFGITDIFQLIGMQKKTGVLTLSRGEDVVTVTFDQGMVVAADSYQKRRAELLGQSLVAAELLDPEDLARALAIQRETGRKLGHILVAEGMVQAEDLAAMVQLQVRETLYGIFAWEEGEYRFDQAPVTYDRENMIPLGCESVLMEAMQIADEWPMVRRVVPSPTMVFRRTGRGPVGARSGDDLDAAVDRMFGEPSAEAGPAEAGLDRDFPLSPMEEKVYGLVDGARSVRKLVALSRAGEFETCKALYGGVTAGLIEAVTRP